MNPADPVWPPPPDLPPFSGGTLRADVAVVGAGLTGLSAAYHLLARQPARRVVVLDAARPGAGASGRSTGMLGPGVGQDLARLARRFGPAGARALYLASLQAVEDARRLITAEAIDCDLHMTGQLVLARGAGGRKRLAARADLMGRLDLPVERLDDAALAAALRLAPDALAPGPGPAALRLPVAGTLHPTRLLAGLAARVRARGGALFQEARVRSIDKGRPARLVLGRGEVLADDVVLATAAFTPDLGLLRGRTLPVHLQVVVTEPLDDAARQLLGWPGREGVLDSRHLFDYFRLTADGRIVFGGGRPRYHWGGRTADGPGGAAALDATATALVRTFPAAARLRVAGGWTGVIDYTLDGLPALGRLPGRPAVLHAGGWCGHGVALALASGAWVATLLDGGPRHDLPWFRPHPPRLPGELPRWLGFRAAVALLARRDGTGG